MLWKRLFGTYNEKQKLKLFDSFLKGYISKFDYELQLLEFEDLTKNQKKQKTLDLMYIHDKISEYEYNKSMIELHHEGKDLRKKLIELDYKFNKIDDFECASKLLDLEDLNSREYNIKKLELEHDFGKKDYFTFSREMANLEEEPYVKVIDMQFDPESNTDPYIEVDWNSYFIEKLKKAGFEGKTDEEIISKWMDAICIQIASENEGVIVTNPDDQRRVVRNDNKTEHFG